MTFDRGTAAHLQPRRARLGALGFIGASAIGWAVSGAAQEGRDTLAIWRLTDTAIVQAIGTGIFGQLGSPLSAASFGEPQPWTIHIPDQASEPWLALRAHLRRALNARLPEASDTASSHISIDALELRADSLVVRFTIGFSWVLSTRRQGRQLDRLRNAHVALQGVVATAQGPGRAIWGFDALRTWPAA
jgi:hypothetical protein